ncbi:MAG: T9SS type A sorting domain-containing protein, partial [bacterium]|nr:T9SS type A sorting domain-containing protein [bacterium]
TGDTINKSTPTIINGLTNVTKIASGGMHTLALLSDGTIKSWGDNIYGELGVGDTIDRHSPVTVPGITNAIEIAGGSYHSIALLSDSTIKIWGHNIYGELGLGDTINRYSPVTVPGITKVVAISAGRHHTIIILSDGTVKAWGHNGFGQLGIGGTNNNRNPVTVPGIIDAIAVSSGGWHSLALNSKTGIQENNIYNKAFTMNSIFSGNIKLTIPSGYIKEYSIYNVSGDLILTQKEYSLKRVLNIDASAIKPGIYFLKIQTSDGIINTKIIKIL